jgi:catechol 2,3-dioxygenase-like lactoylglutathione lyase family enzyme
MSLSIDAIGHIVLNVADLEVSAAWYVRVLGMERIEFESYTGVRVALRFGNQKINLRPADADTVTWLTGVVPVPGSADLCFVTKLSPDAVKANWVARGIARHRDRSGPDGAIRRTRADDLGVLPRSGW